MYTNIPICQVQNIVKNFIDKNYNISEETNVEIINLLNNFRTELYRTQWKVVQTERWSSNGSSDIGNPNRNIYATPRTHNNRGHFEEVSNQSYHRYAADILIIYNTRITNISNT